jgi:hypothetical protein
MRLSSLRKKTLLFAHPWFLQKQVIHESRSARILFHSPGSAQGFPVLLFAAGGRERRGMRGHLALSPVVSPRDGDSGKGLPPSALLLVPRTAMPCCIDLSP